MLFPSAIIFVNNDLTDNTIAFMTSQLQLTQIVDGYTFDGYILSDPTYVTAAHNLNKRIMVMRPFTELNNREDCDVAIFVKAGMASILYSKYGPPKNTYPVLNLTYKQLGILTY